MNATEQLARDLLERIDGLQAQVNALTRIVRAARNYIQQAPEDPLLTELLSAIEIGLEAIRQAR